MSTIIHMEAEQVRALYGCLARTAEQLSDHCDSLHGRVHRMDWVGPAHEDFLLSFELCYRRLYTLLEELDRMGIALNREADQWEMAASRFGG